jgi:hypothetical protein
MIGESKSMVTVDPAGRPAAKEAIVTKTAAVFTTGLPFFIRFRLGSLDRLIPVACQGIVQPGNILIAQWTDESARLSGTPENGMEVQCQLLNAGVLYLVKGVITGSASGRLPRVRISIGDKCIGVKLRSQLRYAVRGKLELLEPGGAVFYAHNGYQKMNISLGGFGSRLPEAALPKQEFTGFRLEALIERDSLPDENYPALVLEGEAALRHTAPSSHEGMVYAGFSYARMNDINTGTLQFWLATHGQILRTL